jgi:hypothetical protein
MSDFKPRPIAWTIALSELLQELAALAKALRVEVARPLSPSASVSPEPLPLSDLSLRELLRRAQGDVCSLRCPSQWRTADGPPAHSKLCEAMRQRIERMDMDEIPEFDEPASLPSPPSGAEE